jgi:hypothetical protein
LIGITMLTFAYLRFNTSTKVGQSQKQFEAAVAYKGGHYPIVQIEIPKAGGSGYELRCVYAAALVGAIMRENRLPYNEASLAKAKEIARQAPRHRFNFVNLRVLADISGDPNTMREACAIIASGSPAYQADNSAELVAGEI